MKKSSMLKKIVTLMMTAVVAVSTLMTPVTADAAPNQVNTPVIGIDVSRYQGTIDWQQVAASGVQFAIIRVGYRTQSTGLLNEDPNARYNLQEASKYGIKLGAYFFSTAVTAQEAVEEATFTANILDKYPITFPVAYNCEGFSKKTSRQYPLGKAERTAIAITFLDTIAARGYQPMFYASKGEMENNAKWDMTTLASKYKVWVSWYPNEPFPITPACTYTGAYQMWQYTQKGAISGVPAGVDINVSYFTYDGVNTPKDTSGAVQISASQAANVQYIPVQEVVTPTSKVNLRTVASTDDPGTIVATINAGDMIWRVGVGNNGWSKVLLNNQEFYAYSQYLKKVQ